MTTQAQVLTMVRARLDEADGEHQWLNSELRSWMNEAMRDIARRTESLMQSDTVTGVVGQHNYTLDSDIVRVHMVEWRPTAGGVYLMEATPLHVFKSSVPPQQEDAQGRPQLWTLWGFGPTMELLVYPTPAEAGTFKVYKYLMPADLAIDGSDASDTVTVPTGWEDLICDYAEYRAKRKDADPDWQAAKALYDEHLLDLYATAIQWQDQAGVITAGNSQVPAWLWADTGY